MTGSGRTRTWSVHRLRRTARREERKLQAFLDHATRRERRDLGMPDWAHGARAEKTGRFQWTVVLTEQLGR